MIQIGTRIHINAAEQMPPLWGLVFMLSAFLHKCRPFRAKLWSFVIKTYIPYSKARKYLHTAGRVFHLTAPSLV